MAHLGTLRDFRFSDNADDIRGAALYGRDDEKLGKIDDVIFNHETGDIRYVVVDTGGWLSTKRFLLPAAQIAARGNKDDEFTAPFTKKQIESFPPYNEEHLRDEKQWSAYEKDYSRASGWELTGDVLHQAGGTNILVPDSIPATGPAPRNAAGEPVSGYKSPIRHTTTGVMNTTPTGWGQDPDNNRMAHVPDSLGAGRGDIEDKTTAPLNTRGSATSATDIPRTSGGTPRTMDGDAIFNAEDVAGARKRPGNVHDADVPSYATLPGQETLTSKGRTPTYPDASQPTRWQRFEHNLRNQRSTATHGCSVCDEFRNRKREDVA
jgi:sporulation protein YlmC with PRC-barrel domain